MHLGQHGGLIAFQPEDVLPALVHYLLGNGGLAAGRINRHGTSPHISFNRMFGAELRMFRREDNVAVLCGEQGMNIDNL